MKVTQPCSARVEYQREPGTSLDYLSVWSVRARGYEHLVCDRWTRTSSAHPTVAFRNKHDSDSLAQTLDFVMKNQDQFTHRTDACRHGLVLIDPPTEDERAKATTLDERNPWRAQLRRGMVVLRATCRRKEKSEWQTKSKRAPFSSRRMPFCPNPYDLRASRIRRPGG